MKNNNLVLFPFREDTTWVRAAILALLTHHSRQVRPFEIRLLIKESIFEDYGRNPLRLKRVREFSILLNQSDRVISSSIASLGWWDLGTTKLVQRVLKEGSVFVDVGANVGWFTLLGARIVGKKGIVLAFEPEPTNAGLLRRSIQLNNDNNVRLFELAASDIDGEAILSLSPVPGFHSIRRMVGSEKIVVPSVKLDTVAERVGIEGIDLLKIDVEGAEPEVMIGAHGLIEDGRVGQIALEWNPEVWYEHPKTLKRLFELYQFYLLKLSFPLILFEPIDLQSMPKSERNLLLRLRKNHDGIAGFRHV
jgi:FkbM family methyltransferase